MANHTDALPFLDEVNATLGTIVAVLSYVFGEHWILFVGYLGLNVADYISGCIKSKLSNSINSTKGAIGIVKKLGYWIMILVSFGSSVLFIEVGEVIGVDLHIMTLLGWFVLAALIINEIRSIVENLVEAGYNVPDIFTKGLEVMQKTLDSKKNDIFKEDDKEE